MARFTVKPVAGLQFAGSYYWGEYGEDYLKRIRYGAGACYDYGRLVLRGEYICGTTGGLDSEGWYAVAGLARGPDIVADGAVRYLSRRLLPRFEPPDQLYGRAYVATCEIPALPAGLHLRRFRRAGCRRSQCGGTDALRHILT